MRVVIEAGGTKCRIGLITNQLLDEYETVGFNPNISSLGELSRLLKSVPFLMNRENEITSVFFYGAGCGNSKNRMNVFETLSTVFVNCSIKVSSDLEGAAIAFFKKSEGIVGILGTGASAGYYNGSEIAYMPPSLGYLIGDEGSGAYLGKELIKRVLRKELDRELIEAFYTFFAMEPDDLIRSVYSHAQPNAYLAGFTPFLSSNCHHPVVRQLLAGSFLTYFEKNIKPVLPMAKEPKLGIVGGIAWQFSDLINELYNQNYHLKPVIIKDAYSELIAI